MAVARQNQMVAIVDLELCLRVEIRPAAAAGLLRRLMDVDLEAGIDETHGGRQAGNAGTNDMSGLLHQMIAYRSRIAILEALPRRTGSRGKAKPRATSNSRMA